MAASALRFLSLYPTRPLLLLASLFSLALLPVSHAIFEEDVGRLDFLIATAGHGPVTYVSAVNGGNAAVVITSDSAADPLDETLSTSCIVASRSIADGSLLWRRNVCSGGRGGGGGGGGEGEGGRRHVVSVSQAGNLVHTLDVSAGVVQSWNAVSGVLLWEANVGASSSSTAATTTLWTFTKDEDSNNSKEYLVVGSNKGGAALVAVYDVATGTRVEEGGVKSDAQKARPSSTANNNKQTPPLEVKCSQAGLDITLLEENTKSLTCRREEPSEPSSATKTSTSADLGLSESDEVVSLTLVKCSEASAAVLVASARGTTQQVTCRIGKSGAAAATEDVLLDLQTQWSAEEGLSQISSALLLDSSHYVGYDVDAQSEVRLLTLQSRLVAQLQRLTRLATFALKTILKKNQDSDKNDIHDRIHLFGFVKIAAMVSQSSHRLYGMDTIGKHRGKLRYALDLPENAKWHRMVHGAPSSSSSLHGINGGTHNRDVLVLSLLVENNNNSNNNESGILHWMCVDAGSGVIHIQGSVALSSPLKQVIPMHGVMPCRQSAMLLLRDGSLVLIPDTTTTTTTTTNTDEISTMQLVTSQLQLAENGFYAHHINREDALFESFLLSTNGDGGDGLESQLVGSVVFPNGERIVQAAYPKRDEAIQAPCNVLGDESLLLKYINPHLVVVITVRTTNNDDDKTFLEALKQGSSNTKTGKQKRKPIGVTGATPDETLSLDDEPNLFVNVIDSVSGRILYRASHANALPYPTPTAVVSENWIFYSFANEKTRRAEVGVLTLYEGMIDSNGLTAFVSPEQSTTFSSLNARESKPVVLSKSYSIAKPVTALGVTTSQSGISSRRLVLAGIDGTIFTIDRKALEPRRPLGELKDSEKKEGLMQYSELIPSIPYFSLSLNRTVDSVKQIVTAPTDLESQSLILAFGGPDIFFTRTSPSRGFDLLPDSFNRGLLALVVAALLVVLAVMHNRTSKKFATQGWA